MIPPHPFFKSSNFRRPYYYYYPKPYHNTPCTISENSKSEQEKLCFPNKDSKNEQKNFDILSLNKEYQNCNVNNINIIENNADDCFEIFGLKLHFDDLLIIALLFFLYQENVKDTYLYIALILLLLS